MKIKDITEGRVEDFVIAHEQAWVRKLEQQIVRYAINNEKGTEWADGAQWVFRKVAGRQGL